VVLLSNNFIKLRQPGWVGCALAILQGWLLCVGFVCLANVLKIAWGRAAKSCVFVYVLDAQIG